MDRVEEGLTFRIEEGVAHLRLNRPESGNAINAPMARALLEAALHCAGDAGVRAVVLDGAGPNFCFGGDIQSFQAAGEHLDVEIAQIITPLNAALGVLARMPAPVIALVRGMAAGGGLGLALSADLTLAARTAAFRSAYTAIGFSGDAGTTSLLPRYVGLRRARELMLTNRRIGAEEALAIGMIDQVYDDGELEDHGWLLARQIAAGAPLAHGAVKSLLSDSHAASFEQQLAAEARSMISLARSSDAQGAVAAFVEKRKPVFQGR